MPPKCTGCGGRTISRYAPTCLKCRTWFAKIKYRLYHINRDLWYKLRELGGL